MISGMIRIGLPVRPNNKANNPHGLGHVRALVLLVITTSSSAGTAADLSWQPQLRIGARLTDNVRWADKKHEGAFGFDNTGIVALKAESADWQSTITPSFNIRRFAIGNNLDTEEYGVRSQHSWKMSERLTAKLGADYQRDSTLTTELTDAGRQNDVANRETVNLQPGFDYYINENTSVSTSYLYSDIKFSASPDSGLVNYKYQQGSLGINHVLTDRILVFASGNVSLFEVPTAHSTTWTYTGQVGVTYEYSPELSFDLIGGYAQSSIDFLEQNLVVVTSPPPPHLVQLVRRKTTDTGGPVASASIRKSFDEDTRTRLDYSRRVSPTIRGAQSIEDDIQLSFDRALSKQWWLTVRGQYNMRSAQAEQIGGSISDLNRDQTALSGVLGYRYSPHVTWKAEYRLARAVITESDATIYVNAFFLTMSYDGEPHFMRGF